MRIRVKAELILTVPEPRVEESAEVIVLGMEQRLNDLGCLHILTRGESAGVTTRVGVRIHIKGIMSVEGIVSQVVKEVENQKGKQR